MWDKILHTVFTKPLFSIGVFLAAFPLPYSFFSAFPIFDHWPFDSGVLATIMFLGFIIMYFGDKYENKKKDEEEKN